MVFSVDKHEYVLIANNVVERNGRHGINIVTGSKHVNVINNQIDYNGFEDEGCGVCFGNNFGFDTRGGFIYQNYIKRSQRAGICIWDSKEIVWTHVCSIKW